MQPLRAIAAALLLGGALAAQAADHDGLLQPGELLGSDSEYRQAWQGLVQNEERLPDWLLNLSGPSTPMQALEADSDRYLVGKVCQVDDCFSQRAYVAFDWDKDAAYALYVQLPAGLPEDQVPSEHARLRWLGEPDAEVRAMLSEQLNSDPDWF